MFDTRSVIAQMTIEEKAALCTGASAWSTAPVERLGVPEMWVFDGPHGVRRPSDPNTVAAQSLPATCFPPAVLQACTWDVALMAELGRALGRESAAQGVDVLLGPGCNMKRSPLCGRNFEYLSEDPHLAGELAAAYIDGVQGEGIGTCIKHYAANNQEFQRFRVDAIVDQRALREIYLPAFETAVKRARPWTLMCAYNKLNGRYCSEHQELLVQVLRQEWGFEGPVISDWGAVHDRVASLEAGLDLEMPGPRPRRVAAVAAAVRAGELDEAVLDEAVRRVLEVVSRAASRAQGGAADTAAHHALARRIAAEGMVLLANDGILPLASPAHIAVIGRAAAEPHIQGGGSSHVNATRVDLPLDALRERAGEARITYAPGYPTGDTREPGLIEEAVAAARDAGVALVFVALPHFKESEGYDREDLDLTAQQVALIQAVTAVQPRTVVILHNGAPVSVEPWIDGTAALLEAWMMGQGGGAAVADVLFGRANPCGRLAETFPRRLADTPAYLNFPGENGEVRYGEGLYIGYRHYDAREIPVRYPFGHGLSYTSFSYANARASAARFRDVDGITVSVDVTNTGAMAGKEVVQVYVHDRESRLARPPKELKGFAKVALDPGETRTVTVPLGFRAFAYYDPAYGTWVAEDGEFEILIGASAADIRAMVTVTLESTLDLPCVLNRESTIGEWLADPRGRPVFEPILAEIQARMAEVMGGGGDGAEEGEAMGMDVERFLRDMPLMSVLEFQENLLPRSAEETVGALLAQARGTGEVPR